MIEEVIFIRHIRNCRLDAKPTHSRPSLTYADCLCTLR